MARAREKRAVGRIEKYGVMARKAMSRVLHTSGSIIRVAGIVWNVIRATEK